MAGNIERASQGESSSIVLHEINTAFKRSLHVIPIFLYDANNSSKDDVKKKVTNPSSDDDLSLEECLRRYFPEIAELADLQGLELAYRGSLDDESKNCKEQLKVRSPENCQTDLIFPYPEQLARLVDNIERQPFYNVLRHGAESIISELRSLSKIDRRVEDQIEELLKQLQDYANKKPGQDKARTFVDSSEEEDVLSASERDSLIYRDNLLTLIKQIGSIEPSSADPSLLFVQTSLSRMFEFACYRLASEDKKDNDNRRDGASNQNGNLTSRDLLRCNHGYMGLRAMIVEGEEIENTKKIGRQKIGYRALAFYLEYYDPEEKLKNIQEDDILGYLSKHCKPHLAVSDPQKQGLKLSRLRLSQRMFAHTWREFISLETLGAILVSVIFSLAFANHTSISRQLIAQGEAFAEANAPMACWLPSGQNSSLPLCSGLMLTDLLVWGCVGFAAYGALKKRSLPLALLGSVLAIFTIMLNFGLANSLSSANLGTQLGFAGRFLIQFIVAGLLTTPATLVLLGALGLSSVLSKERRVRTSPRLNFSFAVISSALGMALIMFLFAAVVEKSRSQVWTMGAIGLIWGALLGLVIYYVFEQSAKRNNQSKLIVPFYWRRLGTVALVSAGFGLFLGLAEFWPREVEFFSLPQMPQMPQMVMTSALAQMAAQANGLGQLLRVVMLSAWIGLAIFIGVEILTEKMMSSGEVKPLSPNDPANPSDPNLQTIR